MKITNRDLANSVFDSLRMTNEGNKQVKETKDLDSIQKYEAFKMEEDEIIKDMFSRLQTLVVRLKVLNKVTPLHIMLRKPSEACLRNGDQW